MEPAGDTVEGVAVAVPGAVGVVVVTTGGEVDLGCIRERSPAPSPPVQAAATMRTAVTAAARARTPSTLG